MPEAETLKLPILHRTFDTEIRKVEAAEGEATRFEVAISSEAPVERWFGIEVLSHSKGAIDASYLRRGLSVLVDHEGDQVGILEDGSLDEEAKKIRGLVRFSASQRGKDVEGDVASKIRRYVSVGYQIKRARKEVNEAGVEVWTATRWVPLEMSVVSVPADLNAGFDRGRDQGQEFEVELEITRSKEDQTMPEDPIVTPAQGEAGGHPAPAALRTETPPEFNPAETVRLAESNGMFSRAAEWIEKKLSPPAVAFEILKARKTSPAGQPPAEALAAVPAKDLAAYSYARAILQAAENPNKPEGLEGEIHQELLRFMPEGYKTRGGILTPLSTNPLRRTLDSKTAGAATEVVFDRPGEMIELLRNEAQVIGLGARVLTGLVGPVPFPKQTAGMTMYWVGENPGADVTASDIATGQAVLSPKTLMGTTSYSRQLLAQAGVDVEALVRADLAAGHALAIDRAAIHGASSAGEPTGIYNAPDVLYAAMGGVPTFAKLVDMVGQLADVNSLRGSLGWLTTPLMAAKMAQTLTASAAGAGFIWTGSLTNGQMCGYPARSSANVSKTLEASTKHGLIFANWADLLIGLWMAMELVVDPYAQKKRGLIEVTSFQMADVLLRHGQSFNKATGATIS